MSYTIRREVNRNRAVIVFEFDPQSEEELFRDFPWLRQIGVSAFGNRVKGRGARSSWASNPWWPRAWRFTAQRRRDSLEIFQAFPKEKFQFFEKAAPEGEARK